MAGCSSHQLLLPPVRVKAAESPSYVMAPRRKHAVTLMPESFRPPPPPNPRQKHFLMGCFCPSDPRLTCPISKTACENARGGESQSSQQPRGHTGTDFTLTEGIAEGTRDLKRVHHANTDGPVPLPQLQHYLVLIQLRYETKKHYWRHARFL